MIKSNLGLSLLQRKEAKVDLKCTFNVLIMEKDNLLQYFAMKSINCHRWKVFRVFIGKAKRFFSTFFIANKI